MKLPPFLLDHWLAAHEFATPSIRHNLGTSTGPAWSLGELLALAGPEAREQLHQVRLTYAPPEGSRLLRERIGQFCGVDPDWIVVTTGAAEALSTLFCLAADPGASIVLPFPSFPAMPVMAQAWSLAVRHYRLDRHSGFAQTAERVLQAVDASTRLVLLNTPHNPTGSVISGPEMQRLAESLGERGIPLLVDEVYHPLYFGTQSQTAAQIPNAIVVSDFSKALSLPGLRLGWIVERDPQRRARLIDLRSYFTISNSPVTEALAAHALAHREAILSRLSEVAQQNMKSLLGFMDAHNDILAWVPPLGGTAAFPWVRDGRDTRPLCEALAREGVLIAPGDCFAAPEHFRLGLGAQASGFEDALGVASRVFTAALRR